MFNFHQFSNFPFFRKQIGQLDKFHKATSFKSHVAGDQLTLSKSCHQCFHFFDWKVFNMLKWSLFEGVKHASATRCFNAYSLHEFQHYSWPPRIFLIAAVAAKKVPLYLAKVCHEPKMARKGFHNASAFRIENGESPESTHGFW